MKVLTEVSRRSNCVEIVWKGDAVVSRRIERARRFYKVGCSKVRLEQEGKVSCGKVCEELWRSSRAKGQTGAGRGRVLGRVCEEGCWRVRCEQKARGARWVELEVVLAVWVWGEWAGGGTGIPSDETDEVCRWSKLEMMASKENAVASLGKVDPRPLLQHFSTFSLRM